MQSFLDAICKGIKACSSFEELKGLLKFVKNAYPDFNFAFTAEAENLSENKNDFIRNVSQYFSGENKVGDLDQVHSPSKEKGSLKKKVKKIIIISSGSLFALYLLFHLPLSFEKVESLNYQFDLHDAKSRCHSSSPELENLKAKFDDYFELAKKDKSFIPKVEAIIREKEQIIKNCKN